MYDHIPYIWLFLAASLFVEGLAIYAWRFRDVPGARPYAFHKAGIALSLLSLVMATLSAGLSTKVFWIKLYQVGTFVAMVSWLAVTLQMTDRGKWINRLTMAGMLVIFAVAVAVLCTTEWSGLFWSRAWVEADNVRSTEAVGGTAILLGGYLIVFSCTGLFIHRFFKVRGMLRLQAGILIFSTAITMAGHYCWRFAGTAGLRQNAYAIAFIVSGFLDAFALFRLRMFDIMPIAQTVVTGIMGDGLVVLDNKGLIVGLNPAAERIIAKSGREARGAAAVRLFEPWPGLTALLRYAGTRTAEVVMNRRYYSVFMAPLSGKRHRHIGTALVFHDISAEKTAQEKLIEQQGARAVLQERDRLGRELHDGQGQLLGYFNMQLEAACSWIAQGRPGRAEPLLRQLLALTQGLNTDIRESITGLKTAASEGFLHVIEDYVRWFNQNYGIAAELTVIGDFRAFSPAAEVQVQRIIQEALTNVRKHSGARHARVVIQTDANAAEITIEDDGCGIDAVRALEKSGSYGLQIMRERGKEIGAEIFFESTPGAGTLVRVRVPMKGGQRSETAAG